MSDAAAQLKGKANRGIIGLSPPPWDVADGDPFNWPMEGYDGPLVYGWVDPEEVPDPIARSGHTAEEWLALADEMVARWQAWRSHILQLQLAERP